MLPYIAQLIILFVLPASFIFALWRGKDADRSSWLLKVLYSGAFIAYLLLAGRWDFVSVYFRYVFAIAYAAAVWKSFARAKDLPWLASRRDKHVWASYAVSAALLLAFSGFFAWAIRGRFYAETPVELDFPLRHGWFYVGQGGNSTLINYHNATEAQRYALDIVALNDFGVRASGLSPETLTRYTIFGMPAQSPCDGRVVSAVDRFPDQIPPQSDKKNVAGNHVVISCKGVLVLLAHLRRGSVRVAEGQPLSSGAVVALVGNSGNTSEPHLHFHAVRAGSGSVLDGEGVPVTFNGWFPVRNSTLRENS